MALKRILVVEDDRDISELICYNLKREGYDMSAVFSGDKALEYALKIKPDLVILDLMLPEVDGLEICRQLKQEQLLKNIPIIILTAKSEEADVVVGLQMGADDYIAKPFSPRVLVARVKALLRRAHNIERSPAKDVRTFKDLCIDQIKHKVTYRGDALTLTAIEFNILEFLSRSPGRVYSREQILDGVWKDGKFIVDRAVDVHIRGLRKKLGKGEDFIQTIRGAGYCFKDIDE
jgi:two-component system, OmpR family, alkaline phosphatase synthesis response regulator PhoP